MAAILASLRLSPADLENLCLLADTAVEQQQSRLGQQEKTKVKKSSRKTSNRKKKKVASPPASSRVQQQQKAPAEWLLHLVAEQGGIRPPAFLCSKRLTISDTNCNLNRLSIPKNVVEDVLYPLLNVDEQKQVRDTGERVGGGGMRVQGHDSLGSVNLCFKFWHSNSMFLFNDGWKLAVERNGLRPKKDVVELWCFRDASMALHFAFCIVREEEEGHVVVGRGEAELKEEEENGVAADGPVPLEREAMDAANDDYVVSVVQKKEEKKNEEEKEHWLRWACKKRRSNVTPTRQLGRRTRIDAMIMSTWIHGSI